MTIITEYPIWFAPLCLLLGAAYAFVLYWKDTRFEEEFRGLTRVLMALRFLLVSFLAFLLLGPFIRTLFREVEKPIIIFAQDNSESILNDRDSAYYAGIYAESVKNMVNALSQDYEVKAYSFGKEVEPGLDFSFNRKQTDMSALFEELQTVYSNRNVGAVIIASDGNYNHGMNPLYANGIKELNAPVYTVALGDTSARRDIILAKVVHNRLAYLGNEFPMEVLVRASQCVGERIYLRVSKNGKELFNAGVEVVEENATHKIELLLTADETGIQHYRFTVDTIMQEDNHANNVKDVYIDILDGRQKILLLSDAPHPDIGAINQAISVNENYEVTQMLMDQFIKEHQLASEQLRAYNLIILHQVPSRRKKVEKVLQAMLASEVPLLFVLGSRSDIRAFNTLKLGLQISGGQNKQNEVQALLNNKFTLFSVGEFDDRLYQDLPPLLVPFGKYNVSKSAAVLFSQKIGMVRTEHPLMLFTQKGNGKIGIVAGEGLWRWRLRSYEASGSHDVFNTLLSKTVQYLSVKDDKSNFKVFSKNNFLENEVIKFEAEVYNDSYELINDPEIKLTIENEEGQSFPFTFSRTSRAYKLEAGMLPIGKYTYHSTVKVGDRLYRETGEFNISPIQVESAITRADHQLLYNIAARHGGKMYLADDLEALSMELASRGDIKPIVYTEDRLKELINIKWIFALILVLVSAEWFFRKRAGVY